MKDDDARLDPKLIHGLEQSAPMMREFAKTCVSFYRGLIEEGLPEDRAFTLLLHWCATMLGKRPE